MQLIEAVKNLLPTLGTNDKFLKNNKPLFKAAFLLSK